MLVPICHQVLNTGEPVVNVEYNSVVPPDEAPRYWIGNHLALRDEVGNIIGVNVAIHDITERRRANEERAGQTAEAAKTSSGTATAAGQGEHVLYVDDEDQLVHLVTRMMERMGYSVTGMTRPADATEALRASPKGFDLVLSDPGMPGVSGLELAEELLKIRPDLPVIITSGYVRAEDARRAEQIGVRDVVLKPNTVAEIGRLIRDRLDALKK